MQAPMDYNHRRCVCNALSLLSLGSNIAPLFFAGRCRMGEYFSDTRDCRYFFFTRRLFQAMHKPTAKNFSRVCCAAPPGARAFPGDRVFEAMHSPALLERRRKNLNDKRSAPFASPRCRFYRKRRPVTFFRLHSDQRHFKLPTARFIGSASFNARPHSVPPSNVGPQILLQPRLAATRKLSHASGGGTLPSPGHGAVPRVLPAFVAQFGADQLCKFTPSATRPRQRLTE